MSALDQRRAAKDSVNRPGRRPQLLQRADFPANKNFRLGQIGGHDGGQRQQLFFQRFDASDLQQAAVRWLKP